MEHTTTHTEARTHPGDAALAALTQKPGAGKKKRQQKGALYAAQAEGWKALTQKGGGNGAPLVTPVKSSRQMARELRSGMDEAAGAAKAAKAARRAAVQAQQQASKSKSSISVRRSRRST